MNILVLEEWAEAGGGSEAITVDLAEKLHGRGHEISMVYRQSGSLLSRYEKFCDPIHLPCLHEIQWRRPLQSVRDLTKVARAVRGLRPDVMFTSARPLMQLVAAVQMLTGVRAVCHLGLPGIDRGWWFQRWLRNRLAAGVSPSQHNAESWLELGWDRERLFVVANWVDSSRFAPAEDAVADREILRIPGRPVVFLGRVVPEKGIEFLLRSFARVTAHDAVLVIVGRIEPDYGAHLDTLLRNLGLEQRRVQWFGSTAEPERFLRAADMVVIPSLCLESFGLVLVEAMSCGTMVLATKVGVFPDILGPANADLLVSTNDVNEMARKIDYWLSNRALAAARGVSLRSRVQEEFGWESSVQRYETILLNVASRTVAAAQRE